MQTLKQSMAVDVLIGPFVDLTDGYTAETAETPTVKVSKNGQTLAAKNDVTTPVHDADGYYNCELDATDTNTLGALVLTVAASASARPVRHDFMVLPANVYDSLVGGTDSLEVDATAISGDTTAANNLELMYDGTGYTAETAPSSRSQVSGLGTGSAAISKAAESYVLTIGTQVAGTVADTKNVNSVTHDHNGDASSDLDLYYQFDIGGNGTPTSVKITGTLSTGNDDLDVYAYDWGSASWEQVGSFGDSAQNSREYDLLVGHVGTGANLGKVRIRLYTITNVGTGETLAIDQIITSYAITAQSVGYANGAIWIDTTASNTNTENYVDGVADNPVSTWAAALTLSSQLGIKRFILTSDSSITLTANSDDYYIEGVCATVALGGQSVNGAQFIGVTITGNDDGSNTTPTHYFQCEFGNNTLGQHRMEQCRFTGNVTLAEAGDYLWNHCTSFVSGNGTPDVTFPVGNAALSVRHYSGGLEINAMAAGDTMSYEADGQFKIAADCTGGAVSIRGCVGPVTDAAGGAVTLTENARIADDTVADAGLTRDWDSVTGEASRSMLNALRILRNKMSISGDTMTVTKEDDTTTAWTATVTGDANADPVTGIDPT